MFGFGGRIGGKVSGKTVRPICSSCSNPSVVSQISHCFPLTFDDSNIEVAGIDGVLDVYQSSLDRITLRCVATTIVMAAT